MKEKQAKKMIERHQSLADKYSKQLEKKRLSERKRKQLEQLRDENLEWVQDYERVIEDPSHAEIIKQKHVDNSIFTKMGKGMESTGGKMQSAGKGMVKGGLHATGAVWTPVIYLGYQGIKHARKKPKNESVEQDLIELIKEVEQAHKDGKITEEQKREYIIDFVDNYYKK